MGVSEIASSNSENSRYNNYKALTDKINSTIESLKNIVREDNEYH